MKVTSELLKKMNACRDGIEWAEANLDMVGGVGLSDAVLAALNSDKFNDANWIVTSLMSKNP